MFSEWFSVLRPKIRLVFVVTLASVFGIECQTQRSALNRPRHFMNEFPNRDVEVFTEALRLPLGERATYLDRVCGNDGDMRERVEALLRTHEQVGDFLEEPPQKTVSEAKLGVSVGEKPGDRIGRYKLLQQIGEGGCGVVFTAEQEEPVRRRVALKIIKPGMDT